MFLKTFPLLETIEIGILIFFTLEFLFEIYLAECVSDYLIEGEGVVDLLSILSGLSFIKAMQAIKLLRTLRAIRIFKLFQGVNGKAFNGIILLQVTISLIFSGIIMSSCTLKEQAIFHNIEQILFLFVLTMIFSTGVVVYIIVRNKK